MFCFKKSPTDIREMPVSVVQRAKRAFVAVLLALARQYGLVAPLAREDSDDAANALWRKVARQVPRKGRGREGKEGKEMEEGMEGKDVRDDGKEGKEGKEGEEEKEEKEGKEGREGMKE